MKSVLLIGVGKFGRHMAKEFNDLGHEIMAVDIDEEKINEILPIVTNAQIGDSTSPAFLESLGVDNYDICIVTISEDFQSSLETTSLLKEMGGQLVVATASSDVQAKFLLRNGADDVIYPEKQIANIAAMKYSSRKILDYFELQDGHGIFEVAVPKQWIGDTVSKLDIRKKYGLNIIAIKQNGKFASSVTPDTVLEADRTLLIFGEYKSVRKCFDI